MTTPPSRVQIPKKARHRRKQHHPDNKRPTTTTTTTIIPTVHSRARTADTLAKSAMRSTTPGNAAGAPAADTSTSERRNKSAGKSNDKKIN